MIDKEERKLIKVFREMKRCGAKRIVLSDMDRDISNERREIWRLEDRIKELEKINEEHQKLVGKLIEENKQLKEIIEGKSIQEMGTSNLYKED